jgi:hypothetical protein
MVVEMLYRGYISVFLSRKKRKKKFNFRDRILDTYTAARFFVTLGTTDRMQISRTTDRTYLDISFRGQ